MYASLLGVLLVRDNGTSIPGSFCRPGQGGTATAASGSYNVLQSIDTDQALIIFRESFAGYAGGLGTVQYCPIKAETKNPSR